MNRDILTITLNPALDMSSEAHSVRPTRKIRTTKVRYDPGGGGINVARVIAEMGGQPEALFVAGGALGTFLDELLEAEGITRQLISSPGQTRLSFTVHDATSGLEYRFVPEGPELPGEQLQACLDAAAAHHASYVVASGSLPHGAPPDTYARLAERTAARGARFVLDCSGEALRETLHHAPVFLVKPSVGELEQLAGHRLDEDGVRETAAKLVKDGAAEMVAVTLGSEGAILATGSGVTRAPAIHVPVHSAVGAGDSFLAAMTLALSEGRDAEDSFFMGVAAGAAAVMTGGTELCRRKDVLKLYDAVRKKMT